MSRIQNFMRLSPSRRWQYLSFIFSRLVTALWHGRKLRQCGAGAIVRSPLFWTPEHISIGHRVLIWDGCRIEGIENDNGKAFKPHVVLGDEVSLQQRCHIIAAGQLKIGSGTTLSFDVMVTDVDHGHEKLDLNVLKQPLIQRHTSIGQHCFLGAGARILAGTVLGDNCRVGANTVVRGHFPAGSIIAGNPARIVKRFNFTTNSWQKTNHLGEFIVHE